MLPATTVLRTSFSLKPQVQMTQNPPVITINKGKKWVSICHSNRDNRTLDKKIQLNRFSKTLPQAHLQVSWRSSQALLFDHWIQKAQAAPVLEVSNSRSTKLLLLAGWALLASTAQGQAPTGEERTAQSTSSLPPHHTQIVLNGLRAGEQHSRKFCLFLTAQG